MRHLFILITLALTSTFATANSSFMVHDVYARATPPNAPTSAIFLTFMNNSDQTRSLISATTPASGKVELHTHVMDGDVMKMRQIDKIDIPANGMTELKPGGLHIMLFDLQQSFNPGEEIDVTLNFANGESKTLKAPVKKVMAGMKKMKH